MTDDTQKRLLQAAGQVFAEKGYEAATVREICRRAKVANIAAVNYYFGDKEKLYVTAVREAFVGPGEQAGRRPTLTGAPAVNLRTFIRHFLEALLGNERPPWHQQLMAREIAQPSPACAAFVREFAEPQFRELNQILAEILPAGVPEEKRHLVALSIIGQCVHHRCGRPIITQLVGEAEVAGYTAEKLAEHIAEFSLAALGLGERS